MLVRLIFSFAALITSTESALAYCSKPDAPYCATRYGKFDDQYDFDRCKSEMESYRIDVESFLSCQRRENQQAIEEFNEAVNSFNRRARGY